jgi:anti-anti-sigma factor
MDVVFESRDGIGIIAFSGSLDAGASPFFDDFPLGQPNITKVIVRMAELDFIDSKGLGMLVGLIRWIRENDGQIVLASPSAMVRRILQLAMVQRVAPITDTVEEATALLNEAGAL